MSSGQSSYTIRILPEGQKQLFAAFLPLQHLHAYQDQSILPHITHLPIKVLQHNVLWLQVAMYDPLGMQVSHSLCQVLETASHGTLSEAAAVLWPV